MPQKRLKAYDVKQVARRGSVGQKSVVSLEFLRKSLKKKAHYAHNEIMWTMDNGLWMELLTGPWNSEKWEVDWLDSVQAH